MVKNSPANAGDIRDEGAIPEPANTLQYFPVFLPGESHDQRSLVGDSS